jgi:selenocysteine lyase/cysteine desulfurase
LEHLELWGSLGPEELWFEHAFPRLQQCRTQFARLIGADDDEVAVISSVSAGLAAIGSCLDLRARPGIVLSQMDFPTNHHVWRAHERVGAELSVVPTPDGIRVDPEEYVARTDERTSLVNVNRLLFESSFVVDLDPIVHAAHEAGALTVVDDFHGTGIVPIDVHATGVDLLVTGALKWLCGGQGIAFLYCKRELIEKLEPLVVGWFGVKDQFDFDRTRLRLRDDARRFETGTLPLPQAWTAAGGLEIISEVGVDRIRERNQQLTSRVIAAADDIGLEVMTPRENEQRGGLVRVRIPGGRGTTGRDKAEEVLHRLFERDVVLDSRADCLRISPHFFNNESDIDRCFEELKALSAT